jgi:hypothetical protein
MACSLQQPVVMDWTLGPVTKSVRTTQVLVIKVHQQHSATPKHDNLV